MDIVQSSPTDGTSPWSFPKFSFFRDNQRSFSHLALHTDGPVTLTGKNPERITIEEVSASYLSTLQVPVALGRDLPATLDQGPGAARYALISNALWQRQFNADPGVIGQTLSLDNEPWEIAGVLPEGFRGLSGRAEALVNLSARSADALQEEWGLEFSLIGRLRPEVDPRSARNEAEQLGPRIYAAYPMREGTFTTSKAPEAWGATARSLDAIRTAPMLRQSMFVLFGATALVLLIACVNLANLLVARALARRQEIAVRLAIGAGRGRLVRMLVTESLTLAFLGGVCSVCIGWLGARAISALNEGDALRVQGPAGGIGAVSLDQVAFDGRALAFTMAVTAIVGLVFGLIPALRATRTDLVDSLKSGSAGGGAARRVGVSRRVLVSAEIALAVILLSAAGLMGRSLAKLLDVDPGFDADGVLTLRLNVTPGAFAPDSMPGFYDQLQEAVAAVPGVTSVSLADCPPLNNGCNGTIMTFADRPASSSGNAMVGVHWVSPNWFQTLHVPLKRGRLFADTDRLNTPRVVLINEAAARQYFPGEDPIGKRIAVYQGGFDKGAEIVGIVGDVRYGTIDSTARPDAYISYGQARLSRMMLFVRSAGDPVLLTGPVREAIRRVAPAFPVHDVRPMTSRVSASGSQARFGALLLALFAGVALSLALIGIYGVMSFAVARRTRELGIRMALGASGHSVRGLVLSEVIWLTGSGLVIGLLGALATTRVLRSLLFEVSTTDPMTYVVISLVLTATALAAGWIPARKAARLDPVTALRRD